MPQAPTPQAPVYLSSRGHRQEGDGVDHINIHNKAQTELGRLLSDYAHTPFVHPYFGPFYSAVGFWYWLRTGKVNDKLRYLSGGRARTVGTQGTIQRVDYFSEEILAGLYQKIIQTPGLKDKVIANTLTYDQYYIHGPSSLLVSPRGSEWFVDGMIEIDKALKQGQVPSCWINAERRQLSSVKP